MNFNVIEKNDARESNYRLLGNPVKLRTKVYLPWCQPDGDGWEEVGGVCGVPVESETEEVCKRIARIKSGRKQRAARAKVPRESIKVVPLKEPVRMVEAVAQFEGIDVVEAQYKVDVMKLEAEIKRIMDLVNLQTRFNKRRTR